MEVTISRHCVASMPESGLSPFQESLLSHPAKIRIADAPTGTGKSFAFEKAVAQGQRVLFIVPTRRLANNLMAGMLDDLVRVHGWSDEVACGKIALWSSDARLRIEREEGTTHIGARRIREIYGIDPTREEGEMIIAIPETVSHLLLRNRLDKGQSDAGVFDLLSCFSHIVFDEFHTISARGFGLAALLAKLAAAFSETRARVSFLSATPVDIRPVLSRLAISHDQMADLREELTPSGRVVHGNVLLSFHECPDLSSLLEMNLEILASEVGKGRQVVVIFDSLGELQRQLPNLELLLRRAGVSEGRTLVINSIDDSRVEDVTKGFFAFGRNQPPESFDVLLATASVEMGVTFRSDLLLMEPGFEPMNFLQRYGRAARGDHAGHVLVRWDRGISNQRVWMRELLDWTRENEGKTMEIGALTELLSRSSRHRFESREDDEAVSFGELSRTAAFSAGLYWNVLMEHPSNRGARRQRLFECQPKSAKLIHKLLKEVRSMEQDPIFGCSVKDWCDRFEQEARILRDIDTRIRVVEEDGTKRLFPEVWLRRETDILDRFPLSYSDEGLEEVRITGLVSEKFLEKRCFIKPMRKALFPHVDGPRLLEDDAFLVKRWCSDFRGKVGRESDAWELYPDAMKAAEKLVSLTGLVVCDDREVDSCSGIL